MYQILASKEEESTYSREGINRCLSPKQLSNLLETIEKDGIGIQSFLPEIQAFLEKYVSHRCSRMVLNETTLDVDYTAPKKHILEIRLKRIRFPISLGSDFSEFDKIPKSEGLTVGAKMKIRLADNPQFEGLETSHRMFISQFNLRQSVYELFELDIPNGVENTILDFCDSLVPMEDGGWLFNSMNMRDFFSMKYLPPIIGAILTRNDYPLEKNYAKKKSQLL